jgi:hypothetical protein
VAAKRRFDLLTLRRAASLWGEERQRNNDSNAGRKPLSRPQNAGTTKQKTNLTLRSRGAA